MSLNREGLTTPIGETINKITEDQGDTTMKTMIEGKRIEIQGSKDIKIVETVKHL